MLDSTAILQLPRGRESYDLRTKVLVLFGTRPEVIKLAPVIRELRKKFFQTVVVSSTQHRQLLKPFLSSLEIEPDFELGVMRRDQSPNVVCSRIVSRLDKILESEQPDLVLVQGDTTTTLAGALAAFNRRIPVGHVEAGLRSGNRNSPFPEEMNRRLVTQLADLHFAATENNRLALLDEGVPADKIFVTGNPVVDALKRVVKNTQVSDKIAHLLEQTAGQKRMLVTTHRRESFGSALTRNLRAMRDFVEKHDDVCMFFPVHPNPNVRRAVSELLGARDRVHLLGPLDYSDFLALMKASWLVVSDSGGVQEEAPSLGKPLLIIRENTERPEAISAGVAKLVGRGKSSLTRLLNENYDDETWIRSVKRIANPFGDGRSSQRIVSVIDEEFAMRSVRALTV
jgi:UDP-N-acetylglucosamine 2-epimerase (non-hydrolysing)